MLFLLWMSEGDTSDPCARLACKQETATQRSQVWDTKMGRTAGLRVGYWSQYWSGPAIEWNLLSMSYKIRGQAEYKVWEPAVPENLDLWFRYCRGQRY